MYTRNLKATQEKRIFFFFFFNGSHRFAYVAWDFLNLQISSKVQTRFKDHVPLGFKT